MVLSNGIDYAYQRGMWAYWGWINEEEYDYWDGEATPILRAAFNRGFYAEDSFYDYVNNKGPFIDPITDFDCVPEWWIKK